MKHIPSILALVVAVLLAGCDGPGGDAATASSSDQRLRNDPGSPATTSASTRQSSRDAPDRLLGTWVAHDVDSKVGDVKIELSFKEAGPVKIAAWSELPLIGQVRSKQAPYEVNGNQIHSDALRGGTTVKYRFEKDHLIVEYKDGKTVRFTRQ